MDVFAKRVDFRSFRLAMVLFFIVLLASAAYQTLGQTAPHSVHPQSGSISSQDQIREIRKLLDEEEKPVPRVSPADPARLFREAYAQIRDMLEGAVPPDLKRAVFLVENASRGNRMRYEDFQARIDSVLAFCYAGLAEEGFAPEDPMARRLMLHRLYTDTLRRTDSRSGRLLYHYPFRYDFEDFWGDSDWSRQFVSRLLQTGAGQCHSMPLLYLILARELGLEAYLAYSPNHSYIRFRDGQGTWHNFETTNGHMVSDKWIMGSQYIKTGAIRHRLYMDTLGLRQQLAVCLNDLNNGFQVYFGIADGRFPDECSNLSLRHYPQGNLHALATRSNMYLQLFDRLRRQMGVPEEDEDIARFLESRADARMYWRQHEKYYDMIRDMGYEDMPPEVYEAWLRSVEDEKEKRQDTGAARHLQEREVGK